MNELDTLQSRRKHNERNIQRERIRMNELDTLNMSLRQVKGKSGQKLRKCSLRASFEQETQRFLKGLRKGNIGAMVKK